MKGGSRPNEIHPSSPVTARLSGFRHGTFSRKQADTQGIKTINSFLQPKTDQPQLYVRERTYTPFFFLNSFHRKIRRLVFGLVVLKGRRPNNASLRSLIVKQLVKSFERFIPAIFLKL